MSEVAGGFESLPLLAGLSPEKAAAVRELVREREQLSERYRRLIETTSDAIVITDPARCIVFANPAAHELFGYPESALLGMPVVALLPPEARDGVARHENAAFAGAPQRYETIVVRADGERRTVSVGTAPLREGDAITGVVASLRDVTDERRAEARYSDLVETATDAIFTVDADGRFTTVNRTFELAVGRERAALLGARFADVLEARQLALAERLFAETFAGGRQRAEIRFRDANGQLRVGSITTSPIEEHGRITGGLGIVRDVTEERRLGEELLRREKLAAIGQLVSGVAHELNNPLAGIMAFAQLLQDAAGLDADTRDAIGTIQKEAKRAAKIVSNLLLFARQRHPERTTTDVNRVLAETLELRAYVLRTQQIEVITALDETLPAIWADPFQLQQVIMNLLTNAEQALRRNTGTRRIELRTRREGDRLVIAVSDTGPGIAPEQIDRIFDPFYTTKPVGEGTGLGLSISHGIVRQHGGELRVCSSPGEGATFEIELPLAEPPDAPGTIDEPAVPPAATPLRFLLVDDEPAIRVALARHLERAGHAADAVATGGEALALLRARRYDAIFLDLRMPDLGGEQLFETLRESDPDHASRVVFATGDIESEGARAFLRRAARPFVGKPFGLATVAALLAQAARR